MPKRVFIVHGWGGHPEEGWLPWLKNELEARGFEVSVPALPDTENPRIETWVPAFAAAVGTPDEETFFVGHSMGCQTIARYLESLSEQVQVGGVVYVAGFFTTLTNVEEDKETQETAAHWMNAPIDFEKVRSHGKKSVAIFSDDDTDVPLDNQDIFREKLGATIIIEHNKGHFTVSDGVVELPVVLEEVIKIAS